MKALLDVNVMIALVDPAHIYHADAHRWFVRNAEAGWCSCPLTQNGFVRVLSNPSYPNIKLSVADAIALLAEFTGLASHTFVGDDVSLIDESLFRLMMLQGHRQISDAYLLGLCQRHHLKLATFDGRMKANVLTNPRADLIEVISDK